MLLNAAKCQGYSFYRFWIIQGKTTGEGGGVIYLPTQIMLFRRRRGLKMYVHVTSCIKEELIR